MTKPLSDKRNEIIGIDCFEIELDHLLGTYYFFQAHENGYGWELNLMTRDREMNRL